MKDNCDVRLLAMSLIILRMQDPTGYKKNLRKALKDAGKTLGTNKTGAEITQAIITELNLEDK